MQGILYFSSTGNSLYLAKLIKEKRGGEIRYIPTYEGDGSEFDSILVVSPIYSFGLPVPVDELLSRLNKDSEIIFLLNYGGMVGGADRLFVQEAKKHGLNVKGVFSMKMPENYTLVMCPPPFYIRSILKSAPKRLDKILKKIDKKEFSLPKGKAPHEDTYRKNRKNWHKIADDFSTTDKCAKCGKCVELCPSHNIKLVEGKIVFGNQCIACLGCFHRCPVHAIIYKGKDNKKHYFHPLIDDKEMGKDQR